MLTYIKDGQVICQIDCFTAPTTAACWLPDGESFVVSSLDTAHSIEVYNLDDELIHSFSDENLRVFDMKLSPDNTRLVALTEQQIIVYDFVTKQRIREYGLLDDSDMPKPTDREDRDQHEEDPGRNRHNRTGSVSNAASREVLSTQVPSRRQGPALTSVSISKDSKYMLVSQNPNYLRLMHIDSGEEVRVFEGHLQEKFMIRSSWGGAHEAFVVSGSEGAFIDIRILNMLTKVDNKIYVWRATTGQLIERLEGHDDCVNCISWNPSIPGMFASASDDGQVKVYVLIRL
jgi:WD repeat-containing protein 26